MTESRSVLVLILGASRFPKLPLEDNPAFANSARLLQRYFEEECRGPGGYIVESLFDSELPVAEQADHIRDLLARHREATDLIIYYVGHGAFLRNRSRNYFLALRTTRRPGEELTGLRPETLSDIINEHFVDRRVYVILDCCFAGEAVHEFQSDGLGKLAERGILQRGTALLVASSKDEPAISPTGRPHTMFCECLMDVLAAGIPGGSRFLSLETVAERLRYVLVDKFQDRAVFPEIHSPRQHMGSVANEPLFANPAYAAPQLPKGVQSLLDNNDLVEARRVAVDHLERMLDDEDTDLATLARHHLERLAASDDSRMVARLAMGALERHANGHATVSARDALADPSPTDGEPRDVIQEPWPSGAQGRALPDEIRAEAPTAREQVPPPGGGLRVSIKPEQSTVRPNGTVKWKCTVSNLSSVQVRDVTVTYGDERVLAEPFDLAPGDIRRLSFQQTYGTRGGRMTVQARGRDERGEVVAAQDDGRVRVARSAAPPLQPSTTSPRRAPQRKSSTAKRSRGKADTVATTVTAVASRPPPPTPPATTPIFPSGRPDSFDTEIQDVSQSPFARWPHLGGSGSTPALTPSRSVNPIRFRAALRRVKANAELGDVELNTMIRLVEEGERHYRVLVGNLAPPPNWARTAEAWTRDAALARDDDVVMLKLAPPSAADILENLRPVVRHIELATGVPIPLDEF